MSRETEATAELMRRIHRKACRHVGEMRMQMGRADCARASGQRKPHRAMPQDFHPRSTADVPRNGGVAGGPEQGGSRRDGMDQRFGGHRAQ